MSEETLKNDDKPWLFKPGNPGGPGRPKGISITDAIKRKLEDIPEGQQKTYLELLILKILKKAVIDEDHATIKDIWNYVDGLPKQPFQFSGDPDFPVNIIIK